MPVTSQFGAIYLLTSKIMSANLDVQFDKMQSHNGHIAGDLQRITARIGKQAMAREEIVCKGDFCM